MPANPTNLRWTQPQTNEDGSAFDQSQYGGYELEVNGASAVAIPVSWDNDGEYAFPLSSLGLVAGSYTLRLRVVTNTGVSSDWSAPVTFQLVRVPRPPFGLSVA